MTSYTRILSSYRRYRTYNRYSHALRFLFLDLLILGIKAAAVICLAWFLYKLGSGFMGHSRKGSPVAAVHNSSVDSQDNAAWKIPAKQNLTGHSEHDAARDTSARQMERARPIQLEQVADQSAVPVPEIKNSMTPEASQQTGAHSIPGLSGGRDSLPLEIMHKPLDAGLLATAPSDIAQHTAAELNELQKGYGAQQTIDANSDSNTPTIGGVSVATGSEPALNQNLGSQPARTAEVAQGSLSTDELSINKSRPTAEFFKSDLTLVEDAFDTIEMAPLEGEVWIRNQSPYNYTVQYGTSTSLALIQEFRAQFPEESSVVLFQFFNTNADQEAVYGILHGVYGTVAEARNAIAQMPEEVRGNEPWVRRLDEVQNVVLRSQ